MANTRLVLEVDVQPGDQSHARHTLPSLRQLLERLPQDHKSSSAAKQRLPTRTQPPPYSQHNFIINVLGALIAYTHQQKKTSDHY